MLKKLFKLGVLACLMAVATTASAQEEYIYPHYGFWSNWSIGASIDFIHQGNHGWNWAEGSNIGATLLIEKELNHVWTFRITGGVPAIFTKEDANPIFDRYGLAEVGFKFSINNAILGYNPDRKGSIYLLASGGAGIERDESQMGNLCLVAEAGLGFSYKVCKHSTLFIEAIADDHADITNFFKTREKMDLRIALGYLYNFGPTAADEELIAQRALLTQENFDALNNQVAALENDLKAAKEKEQKLENRIAELENEVEEAKKHTDNGAADSLQAIIDKIRAEQGTFYAMPFSIQYGVDEWKVSDEEMNKIKAVAHIMKDNPDTKFNIVGFCDYTGSDEYNMKLSQKRAEEVKRLLVKKYGIAEDRLDCEGKGKSSPFGDAKYSINRRVSFYRVME